MDFTDTLTIDAPRKTGNGYLAASVLAARVGIQDYAGYEIDPDNQHGLRDRRVVRVYRPETSVFDKASLSSLAHKPITVNHPPVAVTADNWKDYAVGAVGDEIARDGDFIRVPIAIMDGEAIRAIDGGKNQLSCGYSCDLVFGDGTSPDGHQYDAIQTNLKYNHLSVVDLARGGPKLKIGDNGMTLKPVTITIDGASHTVELSDAAAILVGQLNTKVGTVTADLATAQTQIGTLTASISTKDGEIAALTKKLADASAVDVDKLVADRAAVVDAAKLIFPDVVTDKKTDAEIRKQAVSHKLGDAANAMDDNAISGAFAAFAVTVDADTMREGIKTIPVQQQANDSHSGYLARLTRKAQ